MAVSRSFYRGYLKAKQLRKEAALAPIYIHKINKNGQVSKEGQLFGSKGYHASTPEAECERLAELNPGSHWVVVRH